MRTSVLAYILLLSIVSARPVPTPSWKTPSSRTKHLSSETFKPLGPNLSPAQKKKMVAEVLEPEPWERFDGVYLGGKEQQLY